MTPMESIEARSRALAEARETLSEIVTQLNAGLEAMKRQHMKQLKAAMTKVADRHDQLKVLIAAHPELFNKPRTRIFSGMKVGLQKGKGSLDWQDDAAVCKAIKKLLPDQQDLLIKTVEKPVKDALLQLPAATVKRLGIDVQEAGDQIVIKPVDGDVDKLVKALIEGATQDDEEV